ncbi:Calx-beta domain-containing protein [Vibrio campbellii]|uniref:Calx-beta domain-containing protein n=1 Tax=Vibrio campbellii TaxID=680 RepID=UPI00210E45F3|nr:Calx-beta domain-containing protein [Vibrio campbellii]
MDRVTFSSLASNIVVIGIDGEIRTLEPGQVPASGELVITEVSDISQLNFEQIAPDGSSINVTDDITALIEAIAAGEDPAQLEGDFEPAAGESDGSSPQSTGAIDRTGAEALANTDFETVGTAIPLSETQELSLLEFINQQIIIPAQVIVQDISSPTINEGDQASFEVTLDQPTQQETEVTLSLSDDSATGGADYDNSVITITFEDGSTDQINVGEDGTFSVSIPIGDESFVITVDTIDDDVFEGNETFTLSGGTKNQPEPVTGVATITDDGTGPGEEPDDDRPTVASVSDTTVNEGEEAVLEVTLSNPSKSETTVNMTLSDGTAEGGLDYTNTSVTITLEDNSTQIVNVNPDGSFAVTVPANEVSYNVTINTIDDDLFEGTETFTLSGSTENQNGTTSGTGTIVDEGSGPGPNPDDDRPTVASISDTTVNEGDLAILDVTLSNLSTTDTVVSMNLADGSAEGGIDYTNTSVTITFEDNSTQVVNVNPDGSFDVSVPANNISYSVAIGTVNDDLFEGSETFTLSGNTGNQAIPQTGTGTIIDDGTGPGPDPDSDRPTVSISDAGVVNEGDTANFVVSLTNEADSPVHVELGLDLGDTETGDLGVLEYNTGSGWVAVPNDGVVTVPAGLSEFDVRVATIVDEVFEGPEEFSVSVTGLDSVQGSDSGSATIVDDNTGPSPDPDDGRPTVSISDAGTINEGDTANFVVSLTNASEAPVEVQLDLNLGDTEAGDLGTLEYNTGSGWVAVPVGGVVSVPAGMTQFDVRIASIDDEVYEGPENFTVDVTGLGPIQGTDTGTATIVDDGTGPEPDDDRPTVSISDAGTINEGDTANFVVSLTNASEAPVEVQLDLNLGDTEAGDLGTLEYNTGSGWVAVPVSGVVTVPAGLTEFDVRIASIDDEIYEGPENFTVDVTGLGPVQGADTGTATIVDDGTGPGPDPDDDRPGVTISDAGVINEGDTANFVVSLSNASETPVEVQLDLNLGDTEVGDLGTLEYNTGSGWVAVPIDGVVTVPAGLTQFDVRIASIDDEVYEGPENFTVDVTGLGPAQGTDTGTATIVDDGTGPDPDPDDDRPTVSITDAGTINEGDTANFVVSLTNASEAPVEVQLGLNLGDTEAGDLGTLEYNTGSGWVAVPVDGVVTVPAGLTEFDVRIASIDDEVYEGPENFTVDVTGLGPVQGTDTGTATIVDDGTGPDPDLDDDRPTVSISDAGTINEGDTANFVVSLTNASEAPVEVQLDLNLGDTEAGDLGTLEYNTGSGWVAVPVDGVVTVPAGLTEFDVRIASIDDEVYEGPENFTVDVTGLGPVQGTDTGTATIVDDGTGPDPDLDDDRPTVSISDAGTINEGDTANFVVSLTNASEAPVEVQLDLNLGDTEAGDLGTLEYNTGSGWVAVPVDGVVTVPAGLTEFDVRIASIDDEVYEGPENFTVDVTGLGPVQGTDTGTAAIVDDGTGPGPDPDDDRLGVTISDAGVINEGDTANFVVTLANVSEDDVQVELGLNLGDTEAGDLGTLEYNTGSGWVAVPVDGVVTVPAGLTEFDVRIASIDDEVYEGPENFTVDVTGLGPVQGSDTGTATIVDDGTGPDPDPDDDRPTVSISDAGTINEGDTANFVVSLTNASEAPVEVQLDLNLGDTEAGDLGILEYNTGSGWVAVPVDGVVTVPAGLTEFDVRIASIDDEVYEGPENFTVDVTGLGPVQGTDTGTATIVDDGTGPDPDPDDDRPTVSISDAGTINEGDTANFVVSLTNASEAPVEVQLDLNLGDTEAGDLGTLEYNTGSGWVAVPVDGVVTVPAGLTEFDVRIASIDDEVYEGPENFTVDVTGLGPVQGTDTGTATIVDDGTGPDPDLDDDRPTVSISDAGTINEGDTANFVVSLTNASEAPVEVQLDLNLGNTEAGDLGTLEYNTGSGWVAVPVDGVVSVPAGLTEFDVRIDSIDDEVYEGPENFTVDVTGLGPVQGTDTGTATIVDDGTGPEPEPDDDRPTVSISDAGTINEGDTANFVVSLTNASEAPVEVQLDLNLGDTEAGDLGTLEYNTGSGWVAVPINGVVSVPAGLTEFDVRIASIDDEVYEGPENFTVDVTGLGPVQGTDTGTATIVDDGTGSEPEPDDDRPTVSISDAGTINEGDTANFVVSLTNASEAPVEVQLDLNLGDTEAGDLGTLEYNTGSGWVAVPVGGVVSVPAGMTQFDVRIASIDDEVYEGPENFTVDVTGLGPVQGTDTGSATIVDDGTGPDPDPDDDRPTVSISDAGTINEGDTANFVVSLTNESEAAVQVQLTLNTGDTGVGDLGTLEYNTGSGWVAVPVNGMVSVPAGLTEFDVRIASIDDEVYEGPENFTVDVTGLGPVQGTDTGTATIVDDGTGPDPDPDDDRPTVSISDAGTINEGDTANFVVSLTNASEAPVEVQLDLNLGDTEAGDLSTLEYNTGSGWVAVPVDGVVTVPAGLTEFDVRIASIDDEVYEGPENFTVDVTGLGPVQGTDTGTATIVDDGTGPDPDLDDDRPTVSISDAGTINEGDTANFVVSLTNASEAPVEVQLDLNLGNTEAGDLGTLEYNTGSGWVAVPVDGVVSVPAGLTEFDVRIDSIDDEVYEGPENFTVDVTGLGPVQGTDTGTATIVDDGTGPEPEPDDDRPTVSISDAGTINEGDTANFVVSLSNASEAPVEVQLDLNLGDTEVGDLGTLEYNTGSGWVAVPIDGVVTVPAGLTEFDVRIASIDDEVYEGPENFTVDVTGLGPVQGTDTGTATIVDDGTGPDPDPGDDRPTVSITDAGTINEGDTANFVVSLTNASEAPVEVQLDLNLGDTEAGDLGTLEYNTGSGWVAVPNDGLVTVPAGSTQFDVRIDTLNDAVFEQDEDFSVSVVGVGPVLGSDVGNATIIDNDAPPAISDVIDAVVSEEGLTDGIPDSTGSPTDTTNAASFSGSFTVGDPDTANVSVVLSGPNTLTSGGEPVSWAWNSNTQTLTASTASLAVVATVVLTEPAVSGQGTWGYTITLLEPLDHPVNDVEDLIDFDLQISVSDGQTTSSQSMNVVVEDDCPHVPTSFQAVDVSLTDIPEILTGNISFVGNEPDAFSRIFGDVEVTALGFLSNESTDLGTAEINQTSSGIGVKSVGNNGYPLANEVDYRFANDTGVSEQLIIDLGDKIAFGAEIEFEKMFGGELEEGLASFYRDGVLIAQQSFSSDAASGDYAANFSVQQGGFDKVILEATGNGNGPNTADNSDFTVKSITFTGADSAIPIATAEGNLGALYGADGPGSIVLNGAESGLETLDGEAISVGIDPQNPNRLVGEANGELAFEVQLTPSTGKWEFFQYVPLTSASGDGDIDFSYTITDNDGDSKAGNFAVNPYAPPIVEGVTLNVSEEGLGNAIADDFALNGFMDTTDSTLDMDQLTLGQTVDSVALNVPTANLTSNGEAITWALSNNDQLLVGSADGEEVIKISVNDTGAISTELLGPIDHPDTSGEDSLNIEVPVVVSSALGLTNSAVANVVIEDDSPDSTSIVHDVVAETKESANVQLIMDVSGSMRTGNRLQIMKDSATQLLNQYESIGQTRVQIIKYSGSATTYAIAGATWLTVDEAKAYIDTLTAGGATNYNRAINEAKDSWDDAGKLPSASNVSYFLSDGQPNPASSFINDARENSWIDHLTDSDNQITALAYGMGVNLMPDQLDRVAYDGFLNQDLDGVVVPDVTQLPPVMLQSVIQPVGGNLMYTTSPDTGIGADGGYISEIEHDGVTYSFDGTNLTVVDNNNDISHAFDDITMLLTIYIDSKHTLEVDLNDGAYAFYGAVGDTVETLDFDYVLTDNDGDQSENTLQFVIDENGGVNAASGGAANIIEAEVDLSHDILIGNDNEADIFRWVNDSLDSGTDLVRGFERDLDILDLNQVVEDAGHNTIEELLNSIDLNVDGEDLSLEITHNEGNSIQTIVIEKGASEFSDLIIGNLDFERDVLSALTKVNLDSYSI